MLTKKDLVFDKDLYEKCLKGFQIAEDYLGLKMHIHTDKDLLENGQIFLFNHYARFETVIPVYIFYKRLGVFTRTIADHQLFESNERLKKFLCGAGAVPNNLPGLLPFLAAELLKGHKVVIFPEGAMVKTRQVMNEENQFMIFSQGKQIFRKHHSGAAVLALTLDLFKRRIQSLFEKNDQERLDHWRDALGFASHDELKASVEKPTLIVPGTITFTPLRIGGNFLSKTLKFLNRNISDQLFEEAIIEGNILLKHTDMDIRFGQSIQAHQQWTWWEAWLIDNYFLSIKSLDEFFGLREQKPTRSLRLLSAILYRKINHIRDEYIQGLYKGITINTGHIGACLVYAYFNSGRKRIAKDKFHHALYFIIKELQQVPDIHLIHRLSKPENYRLLHLGESPRFRQWLEIAMRAGLIDADQDSYILQEKLGKESGYHEVRLENPLLVSANEVAAVPAVKLAVEKGITKAEHFDPMYFSSQLWDDELRTYAWETEKFHRKEYAEINRFETTIEEGEPYLLTHNDSTRMGVLLIHGFLSSPAELADYGNHIHESGYNVLGVRLAGHGTSPCDLATRHHEDWLDSVRRGFDILSAISSGIIMIGFSTGGTLALLLAAEKPDGLKATACVNAALKVKDSKLKFAPIAHMVGSVASLFMKKDMAIKYKRSGTQQPLFNYQSMPISALVELWELMNLTLDHLPEVDTPLLIMQGSRDTVVDADSARIVMEKSGSIQKRIVNVETESHFLIKDNINNTWDVLDEFIDNQQ